MSKLKVDKSLAKLGMPLLSSTRPGSGWIIFLWYWYTVLYLSLFWCSPLSHTQVLVVNRCQSRTRGSNDGQVRHLNGIAVTYMNVNFPLELFVMVKISRTPASDRLWSTDHSAEPVSPAMARRCLQRWGIRHVNGTAFHNINVQERMIPSIPQLVWYHLHSITSEYSSIHFVQL